MKRAIAVACVVSTLAALLTIAPVAGGEYVVDGQCKWFSDPFWMVMPYDATFQEKDALHDHIDYMKSDCAQRDGALDYEVTTVTTWTVDGQCRWYSDPFWMFYSYGTSVRDKDMLADYKEAMREDCDLRDGILSYEVVKS